MFDLKKYNKNICLEENGHTYTYAEVRKTVELMRPLFESRSLILCLCENTIPSLVGYIAFMVHDQVLILAESSQKSEVIHEIIENYEPDYIWAKDSIVDSLPVSTVIHCFENYRLLRLENNDNNRIVINSSLQLLLSTSGSTGSSKFVRLSRDNLQANAASISEYLGIREDDVAVTTLPFSYSYGLSIINTHLFAGASVQLTNLTPLNRGFWELIQSKHVSSISGVPYTYEMLKRIRFERFNLPSIRYITQAGGKMTQENLVYFEQLAIQKGWPSYLMYGQTEATARMSYLPPERLSEKLGSIGLPIPNGKFSIVNENGEIVHKPLVKGELVYYGPNVGMGYATGREDLTRGNDWNGQLFTGDIAYQDESGFYYISGRLKRFVKIFGNRVSLDELEVLLHAEFVQCEFVCHGQDDSLCIAYVGAVVSNDLLAYVSKRFAIHRSAIKCNSMSQIPRLNNGKVNYTVLTEVPDIDRN